MNGPRFAFIFLMAAGIAQAAYFAPPRPADTRHAALLRRLEEDFGVEVDPESAPLYREFVKSPEYAGWKKSRKKTSSKEEEKE